MQDMIPPQGSAGRFRVFADGRLHGKSPGLVAGYSTALAPMTDRELDGRLGPLLENEMGVAAGPRILLDQHHSADVIPWQGIASGYNARGASQLAGDGICGQSSLAKSGPALFVIKTADCVPLLAFDQGTGAFAGLHAGWRGAAAGILPNLLDQWQRDGSDPGGVMLSLGPHIGSCCYEVGPDCLHGFSRTDLQGAVTEGRERPMLSLARVLENQALRLGVPPGNIFADPRCTCCHVESGGEHPFASHRRSTRQGSLPAGRNISFIGLG
ncbi:MAG: polyphenol oxidase family protein [Deltaproteobacteria bacterium]|nr:polyphenol oxidase family protein [Deltaproteobacteria bacterium]